MMKLNANLWNYATTNLQPQILKRKSQTQINFKRESLLNANRTQTCKRKSGQRPSVRSDTDQHTSVIGVGNNRIYNTDGIGSATIKNTNRFTRRRRRRPGRPPRARSSTAASSSPAAPSGSARPSCPANCRCTRVSERRTAPPPSHAR